MEPIRVLHVVTYMGRGGLETMIMNYYRNINRNKIQFDFLVHRDFVADYDREIMSLGGKIYRLPPLNPVSKIYQDKLNLFFKQHREYKIVHSHLDCMAAIPLKAAKKNGVSICIAHAHNSNQTKDKKYVLKLLYKRSIPKYTDFLFACGKEAGNWMFGGKKFFVLNNAIDAAAYVYDKNRRKKARETLKIDQATLLIGHVGRFAPQKNHMMLIEIYDAIKRKVPNSKLLLVGTGDLMEKIKVEVACRGLQENVIFAGLRSDVPELLQAMDVFIFPSINEGLPVSIIEAQAAGLPCVISDGVPLECKKTDLIYQQRLKDSVDRWVDTALEAAKIERRNTLGEIVRSGFDVSHEAKKLEKFYQDCYINKEHKERIQWQQ